MLPQQQPFRDNAQPGTTLAWLPGEDEDELRTHRVEEMRGGKRGEKLYVLAGELLHDITFESALGVSRWGAFDLPTLVSEQAEAQNLPLMRAAEKFTTVEVPKSDQGWLWHPWLGFAKKR